MVARDAFLPGLEMGTLEWREVPFYAQPSEPMQPGQLLTGLDRLEDIARLEWRACRQLMPIEEFPTEDDFRSAMKASLIHYSSLQSKVRPHMLALHTPIDAQALVFPFDPVRCEPYRPTWGVGRGVRPEHGLTFLILGQTTQAEMWADRGGFMCEVSYFFERYVHRALGGRRSGLPFNVREIGLSKGAERAAAVARFALSEIYQDT